MIIAKSPNVGPNAGWKPYTDKEASRKIRDEFIKGASKIYDGSVYDIVCYSLSKKVWSNKL